MNAKEIIYTIISENTEFKGIQFNTKTNKIELNKENILGIVYTDIYDKVVNEYPDTKFTKSLVKDVVAKYANEHKYTPVNKHPEYADWYAILSKDKDGKPEKTLNNLTLFFENYPLFYDKFSYNDFTQYENYENEMIEDYMITEYRIKAEQELGFENKEKVTAAVIHTCHQNTFNPFKDAIEKLVWDGTERAETFLIDKIAVEDTKLNRTMTKKWLYALIKRLYEPGCDFDNMLIVYDQTQGTGKTKIMERLVKCLGVNYGYDVTITYDNDKDNVDKLNKTWIVGIDELTNFLKTEPEKAKQFISASCDTARLSYDKRSRLFKRHCVFYGSTNVELFLKDYTSDYERRYWLMEANGTLHNADWWSKNLTDEYLQQIIAEMYYFYKNNPYYDYKTLDINDREELIVVQSRHKTINNDDVIINLLSETFVNKMVTTKYFTNYETFKNELLNNDYQDNNIVPDFIEFDKKEYVLLDTIPVSYVKRYIKEILKRDITSTQYLTTIMKIIGFKYKKCIYNGDSMNCYKCVKNTIEEI